MGAHQSSTTESDSWPKIKRKTCADAALHLVKTAGRPQQDQYLADAAPRSLFKSGLRQECRVPSLRPHCRASSLLRTRPSLRPASVLGASRVYRLAISLGIEATGSHVPHKSLSLVSRRLHAGRRSASRQAPSELRPRPTTGAWFRRRPNAFDTSSTVHSRSSYQCTPDGLSPPFPQRSPPRPLCRRSLRGFEP